MFLFIFSGEDYSEFHQEFSKRICAKWKNHADGGPEVGKKYFLQLRLGYTYEHTYIEILKSCAWVQGD